MDMTVLGARLDPLDIFLQLSFRISATCRDQQNVALEAIFLMALL